jgi:hypothetical protein
VQKDTKNVNLLQHNLNIVSMEVSHTISLKQVLREDDVVENEKYEQIVKTNLVKTIIPKKSKHCTIIYV